MRELAVQSASDNVTDTDRANIDLEFGQLRSEITRIATSTEYNGTKLINGSFSGNSVSYTHANTSQTLTTNGLQKIVLSGATTGTYTFVDSGADGNLTLGNGSVTQTVTFTTAPATGQTITVNFTQLGVELTLNDSYDDGDLSSARFEVVAGSGGNLQIGADNASDNQLTFSIGNATASGLSLASTNVTSLANARSAITSLDTAINTINTERGTLGSLQSRLDFTISNLDNISQNIQASESTIRDTDFAAETANFTRAQILVQAGTAMLAQSNAVSQSVLSLLG
jgi:flagellin